MANGTDTAAALRTQRDIYLASLPRPVLALSAAEVDRGQRSRQALLDSAAAAVPVLLDALGQPEFLVKDACYDLVLAIGAPARQALEAAWGARDAVTDIWIAAMLRHLGDADAMERLWPGLQHPVAYARHLTALALAFRHLDAPAAAPDALLDALVEALADTQTIEGTPFTVAGSALACLTRLSGQDFLSPPRTIQFYNDAHFLYPPPEHPFPFAADHLTQAPAAEQAAIRARVQAWALNRGPR